MSMINDGDTKKETVVAMSLGNPGALNVLMVLLQETMKIVREARSGEMQGIVLLDEYKIYGSDIYVLYNDKCDRDVRRLLILLHSVECFYKSKEWLQELAADESRKINITDWAEIEEHVLNVYVWFR